MGNSQALYQPTPSFPQSGDVTYNASTMQEQTAEENKPRFARIFHSWIDWILYLWQLVLSLMAFCAICGFWQNSSTITLLMFLILSFVAYGTGFIVNRQWYSATFATRKHLQLSREECWKVCADTPSYAIVIARDLKFHNCQTHTSVGMLGYIFMIIFFAAFLGVQGTANPVPDFNTPAPVYNALLSQNFLVVKLFWLAVLGMAAGFAFLLLKADACFIYDTLISLNDDLMNGRYGTSGKGLRVPVEKGDPMLPDALKSGSAQRASALQKSYLK